MSEKPRELVVRQHERYRCDLPAKLELCSDDAERVMLSGQATGADGRIEARLEDASVGGFGVRTKVFLPKGARVLVSIQVGEQGDGDDASPVELRVRGRVQRAKMVERGPLYYLGMAADASEDAHQLSLEVLLAHVRDLWVEEQRQAEGGASA